MKQALFAMESKEVRSALPLSYSYQDLPLQAAAAWTAHVDTKQGNPNPEVAAQPPPTNCQVEVVGVST
jgi:hypothetical protein